MLLIFRAQLLLIFLLFADLAQATNYFISPTGNDGNSGLDSGHPWLTPHHNVNCGDVLTASAGTYAEANFRLGNWGVVTCPSANNVAWLKCATFDACKIVVSVAAHDALGVSQSFWGVQGWEVQVTTPSTNDCFIAFPPDSSTQIHHIIFANNVANGCGDGGIVVGASAPVGVDYVAILGNIVYNSAQDNSACFSGIDIVPAVNSDTVAGTHVYIAGNIVWGVLDPNPCAGITPTDGHGISLDTLSILNYSGQVVVENNISVFNGAAGFQNFSNNNNSVFVRQNTFAGNQVGLVNANPCAELNVNTAVNTVSSTNLAVTNAATACNGAVSLWALGSSFDAASDIFSNNFLFSAAGHNFTGNAAIFTGNLTGTDPLLTNPVQPSAPSCSGKANVPDCAATVIANFTPTAPSALSYGYQTPSNTPTVNPFYPAWLCNVTNLPSGLVTPGCASGISGLSAGAALSGGAIVH